MFSTINIPGSAQIIYIYKINLTGCIFFRFFVVVVVVESQLIFAVLRKRTTLLQAIRLKLSFFLRNEKPLDVNEPLPLVEADADDDDEAGE